MSMKKTLVDDMKVAMREKDSVRLEAVRGLRAAIQREEVDHQAELDDKGVIAILQKLVKQSKESIKQFEAGDRPDLVEKEQSGLDVLMTYMPKQLSDSEVEGLIQEALEATGAVTPADMGKVMNWLKPKVQGLADMSRISGLVKAALN